MRSQVLHTVWCCIWWGCRGNLKFITLEVKQLTGSWQILTRLYSNIISGNATNFSPISSPVESCMINSTHHPRSETLVLLRGNRDWETFLSPGQEGSQKEGRYHHSHHTHQWCSRHAWFCDNGKSSENTHAPGINPYHQETFARHAWSPLTGELLMASCQILALPLKPEERSLGSIQVSGKNAFPPLP